MSSPGQLGKYRLDGILGEGGMGIVYRGYDPHIARTVAIKTIRQSLVAGARGQELLRRFRQEVRAVGRLMHPNIIAIYEYNEDPEAGTPFFVMEYVEGQELKELLAKGSPPDYEKSLNIIRQVLRGLAYSHSLGIVHRDIKPANIILLNNGRVKVADFGIARVGDSELTQTGKVLGTPNYMSPEQCLGRQTDERSDLYSCALVLYELLTGKKAFPGRLSAQLLDNIQRAMPPVPETRDPRIRRFYHQVLKRALAKKPEERFQTALEFIEALEQPEQPEGSRQALPKLNPQWAWGIGGVLAGILVLGVVSSTSLINSDPLETPTDSLSDSPAVRATPLSEQEKQKVERLLLVAKSHLLVNRLVSPPGSNAFHAYQMVLRMDPGNSEAREGLDRVGAKTADRLAAYLAEGDRRRAEDLLGQALAAFPERTEFARFKQELNADL